MGTVSVVSTATTVRRAGQVELGTKSMMSKLMGIEVD